MPVFKYKSFADAGKASNYWLRVIKGSDIDDSKELDCLIQESLELRNILGSIVGKVRNTSK